MLSGPLSQSIIGRAVQEGRIEIALHNFRECGIGRHRQVDDYPYGGGPGMVLRPEPLFETVEALAPGDAPVILLSPVGRVFTQAVAREYSVLPRLVLLCGHYEGVDERVAEALVTERLSVGDFVLTGGKPAAHIVVDVVARLVPGVVTPGSTSRSRTPVDCWSIRNTRGRQFRGMAVPEVLLSGHHGQVAQWRRHESLRRTLELRPDLLAGADLTAGDIEYLRELGWAG